MENPLDLLGRATYVRLTTFRKDGTGVATPVWVVRHHDELLVWTSPTAGKVKRIRRDRHVEIGPCTRRGKPLGRPVRATARILTGDEVGRLRPALVGKYGWPARLAFLPDLISSLLRRPPHPVGGLAIKLAEID